LITGTGVAGARHWEVLDKDLGKFSGRTVELRLYQRVLNPDHTAGNAYWRNLRIE
jgi:hypothetical protein